MLITLLIGVGCGFAVAYAKGPIAGVLQSARLKSIVLEAGELEILTLLLVLMGAAILCSVLGVSGSAFYLGLGALGALFGKRVFAAVSAKTEG